MSVELNLFRDEADGKLKLAVSYWVYDPPNPGWWRRKFLWPYKLVQVGTIEVKE